MLANLPCLVETVIELVTDRHLVIVVGVEVRFADKSAVRQDLSVFRRPDSTVRRQILHRPSRAVALIVGEYRQAGIGIRLPGQRRGDEDAVVLDEICLGVAHMGGAGEAEQQRLVGVDCAAEIELSFIAVEAPGAELDLAEVLLGRAFADVIDDAARTCLAVKNRRRPAQDFVTFGAVGIERGEQREIAFFELQPVLVEDAAGVRNAAHLQAVATIVGAVEIAAGAWSIAQRTVQAVHRLRFHLVSGDDRYRLRRLDQRGVGLGGGGALGGDIAVDRSKSAFDAFLDVDRGESGGRLLRDGMAAAKQHRQRHRRDQQVSARRHFIPDSSATRTTHHLGQPYFFEFRRRSGASRHFVDSKSHLHC